MQGRNGRRARWLGSLLTALMVVGVACRGAESPSPTAGEEPEPLELTAVIPFPSGVVFYPLYVAQDRGYFAQEGLSVTTEPVDGSGQVLQQLLSGQAQIGLPSPGPFMQAVHEGADLVSIYTLFQSNVFSLVTLADSSYRSLADLAGTTVGVGTIEGGETSFVKALLSQEAGLEADRDYELLAVGDGGTASVALQRGEVSAYAASFPDVAIMKLRGLELRNLITEDFKSFFDSLVVVERQFLDQNREAAIGIGRALAKATVWGLDNPEGVMEITARYFPEEADDPDFTLALLKETQSLFALPPEAGGKWGTAVPEAVQRYMGFLVDQGELEAPVDTGIFINDFVDQYNDFAPNDL
jgi:NitT/TauT family transport system substrate-binding protein